MATLPSAATAMGKQTIVYLATGGIVLMCVVVVAPSAAGPTSLFWPVGTVMIVLGATLRFDWRLLLALVPVTWLLFGLGRAELEGTEVLGLQSLFELAGLYGFSFFTFLIRKQTEISAEASDTTSAVPEGGIFPARQLVPFIESEIARSRRFSRTFALVLVGIDERRQRFEFRDAAAWQRSLAATERLLRQTRQNVDRVFHYGRDGFAIILPESTEKDIPGLVRRLRRLARTTTPREGEPGGPLPVHFGATFYPESATAVKDLLRRAEIALRIAGTTTTRYQIDGAEAPALPPAETLRREGVLSDEPEQAAPLAEVSQQHEPFLAPESAAGMPSTASTPHEPEGETRPHADGDTLAPTAPAASEDVSSDDLEVLLAQMNETLKMIRAAREPAA